MRAAISHPCRLREGSGEGAIYVSCEDRREWVGSYAERSRRNGSSSFAVGIWDHDRETDMRRPVDESLPKESLNDESGRRHCGLTATVWPWGVKRRYIVVGSSRRGPRLRVWIRVVRAWKETMDKIERIDG
jgi:hypothetical protein